MHAENDAPTRPEIRMSFRSNIYLYNRKQMGLFSILSTELNYKLTKVSELEDEAKSKYKTSLEQAYSNNAMVRNDCVVFNWQRYTW